ncbi:MAG: hypothetical protein LBR08_12540 [Bacteroidales bacterium]|nr:hypothetical protein [Bacteroidales bacterium]
MKKFFLFSMVACATVCIGLLSCDDEEKDLQKIADEVCECTRSSGQNEASCPIPGDLTEAEIQEVSKLVDKCLYGI